MARSDRRFADERDGGSRGFSFVELVISVAMVSLIAATLSFVLFHSSQKTNKISAALAVQHLGEDLIRLITEDCRLAVTIKKLTAESFELKIKDSNNVTITITYTRNGSDQTLNRTRDADPPEIVGKNITSFDLVPDFLEGASTEKLRSVTIELLINSGQQTKNFLNRVSLLREPKWL